MAAPTRFSNLPDYAFPRLRKLLDAHAPGGVPIAMTIGEPTHPMPAFVGPLLAASLAGFNVYPPNDGTPELLTAITGWITRRYGVTLQHDNLMVLNGTREGLFNACIALCPKTKHGKQSAVLMPNPFYQVYAVAALTVAAEPIYVPATAQTGFLPDYASLDANTLNRVAIAYICSPANPQGSVASRDYWRDLLALAEKHDFIVLADECYSEIWRTSPPTGILQIAAETRLHLSFPLQTLQSARPPLRLCCGWRGRHCPHAPVARLCRGTPAAAHPKGQ
jgi:N-succinyldiaminopimelate aminotransferase